MKSTPEEIEAALANYRKVTAERNKRTLQVYVDAIVNADFEDEVTRDEFTDEQMHEERMGQLGELVADGLDGLTEPTELMDRYDELAQGLSLDGTLGGDLDPEERSNLVEAYFKALEAALREKAPEEVKDIITVPEEFRVLARHVIGICGPGLPHEQTMHDKSFWSDGCIRDHSGISSRILTPDKILGAIDVEEKIALGWDPGSTVDCNWYCVYVQEEDDTWAWKFLYFHPGDGRVFDTIPELLKWFLHYTEEYPPLLEGITAENVIDREVYSLAEHRYPTEDE